MEEIQEVCEEPAIVPVPQRNKLKEFLLDPSSGQYSMSRLCMGLVVIVFMPMYFLFCYWRIPVPASIIVSSLASLATVYGLNSALGAFGRYRGIGRVAREMDQVFMPTMRSKSGDPSKKAQEVEGGD